MIRPSSSGIISILFPAFLASVAGCQSDRPTGLAPARHTDGPKVVWDLFAEPLPEIPLPNDVASRIDPDSPTGRRLNISLFAPTEVERRVRAQADRLTGFSIMGTISVRFDQPLDLAPFIQNHWPPDRDYSNDLVYLINIDPESPNFGKPVPLDFGQGNFPIVIDSDKGQGGGEPPFGLFENDPHRTSNNILFETVDEDVNCNGELDLGEDKDFDGVLDKPNILKDPVLPMCDPQDGGSAAGAQERGAADPNGRPTASPDELLGERCHIVTYEPEGESCVPKCYPEDCLLTFYERETNTLLFRPIVPLDQETRYAVVLTPRIAGANGQPISSPFKHVNHTNQTDDLRPVESLLNDGEIPGLTMEEVAFVWSFTTQSVTRDMEAIRRGLYGEGPMKYLADRFPPEIHLDRIFSEDSEQPNPFFLPGETLLSLVEQFGDQLSALGSPVRPAPKRHGELGENGLVHQITEGLAFTDYIVAGTVETPYFLVDRDGIAEPSPAPFTNSLYSADSDETFDVDPITGRATVGSNFVTFWCFIPKSREGSSPPFPVGIHSHGYTSTRLEAIGYAGSMNRLGIAYCGVDAAGHGLGGILGDQLPLIRKIMQGLHLEPFLDNVFLKGRARDLNNDGTGDSGGDFWTADLFHTRDVVRQTAVDYMQLIRMFRSWDGIKKMDMDGDGTPDRLAGDFNGDGEVDMGGPIKRDENLGKYYMAGCSLGGIMTSYTFGLEPAFIAGGAGSGAAGLTDVALRTVQGGVVEAVYLPLMGPIVSGTPSKDSPDFTDLKFIAVDVNDRKSIPFLKVEGLARDTRVELHNLRNGEWDWAVVDGNGGFRLVAASDSLNATEKRHRLGVLGKGQPPEVIPSLQGDETLPFGDPLEIRICTVEDASDLYALKSCTRFDARRSTTEDFQFQGAQYAAGSRIVSIYEGLGLKRNTPELRRFLSIAQTVIDPGDPGGSAPHYFRQPLDFSYDPAVGPNPLAHLLIIPTVGDMNVPVNTGIHIARAAGLIELGYDSPPRTFSYGGKTDRTENDVILDHFVAEGVERLKRFEGPPWNDPRNILFDLDDVDGGRDRWDARGTSRTDADLDAPDLRPEGIDPLRITKPLADFQPGAAGVSGMRIPYMRDTGQHCFGVPDPDRPFNMDNFVIQQIGRFLISDGEILSDNPCLEDNSCDFYKELEQ